MIFASSLPFFQTGNYSSRQKKVDSQSTKIENYSNWQRNDLTTIESEIFDSLNSVYFLDVIVICGKLTSNQDFFSLSSLKFNQ